MRSHCSAMRREVHRPTAALEDRLEDAVVAGRVGAVDPLAVQAADSGAEPHADHAEGSEVDLGVAVGVGVVLFEVEVALVVEHAVEHEGRVAVGALDRAGPAGFQRHLPGNGRTHPTGGLSDARPRRRDRRGIRCAPRTRRGPAPTARWAGRRPRTGRSSSRPQWRGCRSGSRRAP